jgi:Predicted metal-dependent enzyme
MEDKYSIYKPKRQTSIGGEALIEGIMMRGPKSVAVAIRKSDGTIEVDKKYTTPLSKRYKFLSLPIFRGAVGIFESLYIGMKALMQSAEAVEIEEAEEPSKFEKWLDKKFGSAIEDVLLYASVIFAFFIGIGLFMVLPYFITELFGFDKASRSGWVLYCTVEGLIRIALFLAYIIGISKLKDIQRVFKYHGAEHKSIHCFENEEELTVENVKKYTTRHPRCGTAFLFVVMIVSILVFTFIRSDNKIINVSLRLLLIPLVAGISYEFLKLSGKSKGAFMKIVTKPGLALQKFTTCEPDDDQIEVAIAALKSVLEDEETAGVKNNTVNVEVIEEELKNESAAVE